MQNFESFGLISTLEACLAEKQLANPTEIQSKAIPLLLKGESLVGVAETGSGKTLSYALPILHQLKSLEVEGHPVRKPSQPRAIIVVPTRELGEQVSKVFKEFTHTTRLRVRSLLGGTTSEVARKNIEGIFEILVATPGRLVKLLDRKLINLTDIRVIVFDEADQMMDHSFISDAKRIVHDSPNSAQLVLFSATVSNTVQKLINELFADVKVIRSEGNGRVPATLTTRNRQVIDGKRFPILEKILAEPTTGGTMIFTNTREQCDKLVLELSDKGYQTVIYRGEMDKVERRANLKEFRDGKIKLLIATDLGSRGLDIGHVSRVINYHLPKDIENYIHRVGRTARAGRDGVVINMVTERDEPLMSRLDSVKAKK